jgi:hypothetical protein
MDMIHGNYTYWCELCALKAQLVRARERAAAIPELERKIAELEAVPT